MTPQVWVILAMAILLYPFCWLSCRLLARRCPTCGSKWQTELVGEWGCEMWKCHRCDQYWETPYTGQG